MFKFFMKFFLSLYHEILSFFVEFDVGVYAFKASKVNAKELNGFKFDNNVNTNKIETPKFTISTTKIKSPMIITNKTPSLVDALVIRNFTEELFKLIKIRNSQMSFLCIPRKYDVYLNTALITSSESLIFEAKVQKISKKEIHISHNLKTIEELIELSPYTKKIPITKVLQIPITKYPIKREKFSEEQLELMRTKLAIQAKCKKYSMSIENIYDKFPVGLYDEIKLEKDTSVSCTLYKHPDIGELQLLLTGKRKYDTHTTKAFIKYSEIGL